MHKIVCYLLLAICFFSCKKEKITGNAANLIGTWKGERLSYYVDQKDGKEIDILNNDYTVELKSDGTGSLKSLFADEALNWYHGSEPSETIAFKFTTTNQFGRPAIFVEFYDVLENTPEKQVWENISYAILSDTLSANAKTYKAVIRWTLSK